MQQEASLSTPLSAAHQSEENLQRTLLVEPLPPDAFLWLCDQACILAVGGADKRVVQGADGTFSETTFVNVTLSCDHRVVDGAVGASWLQAFKGYLEEPLTLML